MYWWNWKEWEVVESYTSRYVFLVKCNFGIGRWFQSVALSPVVVRIHLTIWDLMYNKKLLRVLYKPTIARLVCVYANTSHHEKVPFTSSLFLAKRSQMCCRISGKEWDCSISWNAFIWVPFPLYIFLTFDSQEMQPWVAFFLSEKKRKIFIIKKKKILKEITRILGVLHSPYTEGCLQVVSSFSDLNWCLIFLFSFML